MDHRKHLSLPVLQAHFPRMGKYRSVWKGQQEMLEFVAENGSAIIESPTGSGKTAVEYAILKAAESGGGPSTALGTGPLFFVTPNKVQVEQICQEFPELKKALGRNEHPCLYYEEDKEVLNQETVAGLYSDSENLKADEIPCLMLQDCPHRVNQETGETFEPGAFPCPYYQQKYEAKQGGVVVASISFYLFTRLFSREFEEPAALVIDEAHRLAEVIRGALSYEITDWHLAKSVELLEKIGTEEAKQIERFRRLLVRRCKTKPPRQPTLLEDKELRHFIAILEEIDGKELEKKVREAIRVGQIDVREDRVTLKKLEVLIRDLRRYLRSFEFSLAEGERAAPLNYTYAYYKEEKGEKERVQYKLVVKGYYVVPIIQKLLSPTTVCFSATIGDPEIFGYETGIKYPFLSLESDFPVANARIFMPTDTPNLAWNARSERDMTRSIRLIARACKRFADKGLRSLVVTISNTERDKFLLFAAEEGVKAVSYGNGPSTTLGTGLTPKEAAIIFRNGEGQVLAGTAANYAEGVDLPGGIAPVIFFLRPGYPPPKDPGTVFEERRFGRARWGIWNWRMMLQALQVRGRNIRKSSDLGVTFFVSQQFKRFLFGSLPKWLQKAYRSEMTWEECVKETERILS